MGGLLDLSGLWGSRVVGFNKFEKFVFCGFQMGAVIVSTSLPKIPQRNIVANCLLFILFILFRLLYFSFFFKRKNKKRGEVCGICPEF